MKLLHFFEILGIVAGSFFVGYLFFLMYYFA